MSWAGIASNQCISYANLQDAVNNGIFTLVSAISSTGQQATKAYVDAHVSGFNTSYPSYASKSNNQLLVKGDIYNPGQFTLSPQYGMYFTGLTCTGAPSFTFNVTTQTTLNFTGTIPAQTISVNLNGSSFLGYPLNLTLVLNSGTILDCVNITAGGAQTKTLTLPSSVNGPSTLRISIGSGACAVSPPITFSGTSIGATAISSTGQYQYVGGTKYLYSAAEKGYMYTSSDYGATWTMKSSVYNYFTGMSTSDNGQIVMAVGPSGSCYLSSNAGSTWATPSFPGFSDGTYNWTPTTLNFNKVSVSGNGATILLSFNTSKFVDGAQYAYVQGVYRSTNSGVSWSLLTWSALIDFQSNAISSTGLYQVYSTDGGNKYSTNSGSTFGTSTAIPYADQISEMSMYSDGSQIYAAPRIVEGYNAYPMKSTDYGASWTQISAGSSGTTNSWSNIAASDTGLILALKDSFYGNGWYPTKITSGVYNDITSLPSTSLWTTCSVSKSAGYGLIGSTTGLYKTTNGGSTFTSI